MKKKEAAMAGSGDHCIIIDDQLYEVDKSLLKKISKKLNSSVEPKKVKVRVFNHRKWSPSELSLLGKEKDQNVAEKVGVSTSAVASKRRELGIPPFRSSKKRPPRVWTKQEISELGKVSDTVLAAKLNVSITTIGNKRRELGVEKFTKLERDWSKAELKILGTLPDNEVAKKLKIPNHIVYFKRKSLNIQAFNRTPHEDEAPRVAPKLNEVEESLAEEIYGIYENSKSIVKAVAKLKLFVKKRDKTQLKKSASYLAAKYDNFALERCLTLVSLI